MARARKAVRRQLAELRAASNFVGVARDEGFIAIVRIDFAAGIGVREVRPDPLDIGRQLFPVFGRA